MKDLHGQTNKHCMLCVWYRHDNLTILLANYIISESESAVEMGRNKKKNETRKKEVKEKGIPTRSGCISMPVKLDNYQNCVMFCVKTKK